MPSEAVRPLVGGSWAWDHKATRLILKGPKSERTANHKFMRGINRIVASLLKPLTDPSDKDYNNYFGAGKRDVGGLWNSAQKAAYAKTLSKMSPEKKKKMERVRANLMAAAAEAKGKSVDERIRIYKKYGFENGGPAASQKEKAAKKAKKESAPKKTSTKKTKTTKKTKASKGVSFAPEPTTFEFAAPPVADDSDDNMEAEFNKKRKPTSQNLRNVFGF
jgi:hypothetical protein